MVSRILSVVTGFVVKLVMVVLGLVFGAVVLVAGLVLGLLVVVWSLLRGRRPTVVRFRMNPRAPFDGMHGRATPPGDVVDIEAREVPDTPHRLPSDRG